MRFENDFIKNTDAFKTLYERDDLFVLKTITNKHNNNLRLAIALNNCMVNSDMVNRDIIGPLSNMPITDNITDVLNAGVFAFSAKLCYNFDEAVINVASGDTVVFVGNADCVITIDTKGFMQRAVSAPETEQSVIGPSEGFNESIVTNLSLVKKRLMTHNLKNEFIMLGKQSNSRIAICYIDGITKPEYVQIIKQKLESINTDYIADTNYIAEFIKEKNSLFFKTYGRTNRPDVFASKLLEGRVGIILNGSPTALTLPFLFIENFQTPDDYYLNCWYANVGRVLRAIGFFMSFIIPSLYISVILHHLSMLPPEWLYSISASRIGVPVPIIVEILLLFGVFEILRETGTRMPSSIGLALNVVGAIILGQAAVDAKLVSAPSVIIVAFSGVMGLMVPHLKGAVFYIRLGFVLLSAVAGLPGFFISLILMFLSLANINSLGIPLTYMYSFFPSYPPNDTFLRAPIYKQNYRVPPFSNNTKRQGKV